MEVSDGRKLTQTTLQVNGSVVTSSSQPSGKATSRSSGGARGARENVSSQAKVMLDAVEACSGIPLSSLEKIKKLTDTLRDGFSEYRSEKFPIGSTYSLYTTTFELNMALVNILNSTIPADQHTTDSSTTRRMAIGTTSALINIIPSIQTVMTSMQAGVRAIEDLERLTKKIADDFNDTASKMDE